ncbi:MAG: HD domain-containing protein [Gammaproteobacteria bacterium]|nr:HD domain-containing protein [Gammaproteobacteria bacterium]
MPFSSQENSTTELFNFRILLIINAVFLAFALIANHVMDRPGLFLVHAITLVAFIGLFSASYIKQSVKRLQRLYLAVMAVYFYSFFWLGYEDTYDLIWLLLFPALVAFLVEEAQELLIWHSLFLSGVFILFWASWFDAWQLAYSSKLIGAVLFANSFISVLSWFNHRYKAKFLQAQRDFQTTLEDRVEQATGLVVQLNETLEISQRDVVLRLGEICEVRSRETGQHVQRVSEYSRLLAELMDLAPKTIQLIQDASPLHDVGKVAIADDILNKPGKYTPAEYDVMKQHTLIGFRLLSSSPQPLLQTAALIALDHHEWWNGQGYPNAKAGEDIHLYGRIVAIADVFDALSFKRVYKEAWTDEAIKDFFLQQTGKQFDPQLANLFLTHFDAFVHIRNEFSQYV